MSYGWDLILNEKKKKYFNSMNVMQVYVSNNKNFNIHITPHGCHVLQTSIKSKH